MTNQLNTHKHLVIDVDANPQNANWLRILAKQKGDDIGGKPSKGTAKDMRLKENRKPAPKKGGK